MRALTLKSCAKLGPMLSKAMSGLSSWLAFGSDVQAGGAVGALCGLSAGIE